MVLEALGQLFDVFRRPARHFHAEMQAHLCEHFLDFVERLASEIRRPQHLGFALLHEVADVDDIVVLQAVAERTDNSSPLDFEEGGIEGQVGDRLRGSFFAGLLGVDEYVCSGLQEAGSAT